MEALLKALSWTFVHSLWQGLIAALLAAIIISATKRTTAKLRYNLLGVVLIGFLAAACISFFIELEHQQALFASTLQLSTTTGAATAFATTAASGGFMTGLTQWFNNNTGLLLLLWSIFFLVNCLKLFTGLAAVNRLRNYKVHPVTEQWQAKLEQLGSKLAISRPVQLLQSELVKVPLALGYFKPVILVPLGLIANIPPEQAETILLHELGHIRRKDYLVNFIQHFAEAIFFFNPGLLWISSLLRQEREACCDDIVVANSSQKRNYLDALVSFQEYSINHNSYAMAISSRKNYLLNRVKRMMTNENTGINLFEKAILLAGVILFSAFTFTQQQEVKELVSLQLQGPVLQDAVRIKPPAPLPKVQEERVQPILHGADTMPVKTKRDTTRIKKQVEVKTESKVEKKLQEIVLLKEEIGKNKESIGRNKELLKNNEGSNKEEVLKEIKIERDIVEKKRELLNRKRVEYDNLKKQEQKNTESEKKEEIKKDNDERKVAYIKIEPVKMKAIEANTKKISVAEKISPDKKVAHLNFKLQDVKFKSDPWEIKADEMKFKKPDPPAEPDKKTEQKKPIESKRVEKLRIDPKRTAPIQVI